MRRAQPANGGRPPRIGFVATNSITQGEQVAQLWPLLFDRRRLEIAFAHRTFAWGSDARGQAHVHVIIVGLDTTEHTSPDKRLFSYEDLKGEPLAQTVLDARGAHQDATLADLYDPDLMPPNLRRAASRAGPCRGSPLPSHSLHVGA